MLAVNRREKIKELLLENKSVVVAELARMFEVTEETIRRDLAVMEKQNLLTRTYGGAFVQDGVLNDISAGLRENVLVDTKNRIATEALDFISNGDSIFIDHSTTCVSLARLLAGRRIVVTTTSLFVANIIKEFSDIRLHLIGGELNSTTMSFVGAGAYKMLSRYCFDKCFVSCRSLSMQFGITDGIEAIAQMRAEAIARAHTPYLLCDHTKFGRTSFSTICGFEAVHGIISDTPPSEEWRAFLREKGVALYLPQA